MNSPVTIWREHKNIHNYLGKIGKVIVWTKVFIAPAGFEHQVPYIVGIVELEGKDRLPLQIVECEEKDLKPNQKVTLIVRRIGKTSSADVVEYGLKAKLI